MSKVQENITRIITAHMTTSEGDVYCYGISSVGKLTLKPTVELGSKRKRKNAYIKYIYLIINYLQIFTELILRNKISCDIQGTISSNKHLNSIGE